MVSFFCPAVWARAVAAAASRQRPTMTDFFTGLVLSAVAPTRQGGAPLLHLPLPRLRPLAPPRGPGRGRCGGLLRSRVPWGSSWPPPRITAPNEGGSAQRLPGPPEIGRAHV